MAASEMSPAFESKKWAQLTHAPINSHMTNLFDWFATKRKKKQHITLVIEPMQITNVFQDLLRMKPTLHTCESR